MVGWHTEVEEDAFGNSCPPIHVFHSVYCLEIVYGTAYRNMLAAPKAATTGLVAVSFRKIEKKNR